MLAFLLASLTASAPHDFFHKASLGNFTAVKRMIEFEKMDVNMRNENHQTALLLAAHEGHDDVVQLLLEKGADVNAAARSGETALFWSCLCLLA